MLWCRWLFICNSLRIIFIQSYSFGNWGLHAKFQNPSTAPSGSIWVRSLFLFLFLLLLLPRENKVNSQVWPGMGVWEFEQNKLLETQWRLTELMFFMEYKFHGKRFNNWRGEKVRVYNKHNLKSRSSSNKNIIFPNFCLEAHSQLGNISPSDLQLFRSSFSEVYFYCL